MRISDWSSDVCSSDLTEIIVVRGSGALQPADGDNVQGSSLIAYPEFGLGSRIENRLRDEAGIVQFRRSDGRSAHPTSQGRSEEHTSELQSLMRISYAVFCLKKKKKNNYHTHNHK